MAGLVHPSPQFGFRPIAVDHSPSPLNYGFGLSGAVGFPSWQPHSSQTPPTQPSQSSVQKSTQKRKHEDADEDELMDRSPTPERRPIRRIRPVRSRLTEHEDKSGKEAKPSSLEFGDGIDVGMLLASLPSQSLLPILTSLLSEHPNLKPIILSKIPRPTLAAAISAVNRAAKKLRDEHPYSAPSTLFPFQQPTGFSGFENHPYSTKRPNMAASASTGSDYGRTLQRDQYVLDRLRPVVNEYVSTVSSYLRYFSCLSEQNNTHSGQSTGERETVHPSETFEYLSVVTEHALSQSQQCHSILSPLLVPRLLQEWMAWVDKIDLALKEGGIFGANVAQTWIDTLDRHCKTKADGVDRDLEVGLKAVRDRWLTAAGFLIGRRRAPFVS